ncbi:MAG: hypothetical protein RLZZ205_849, partial [Bacteroidota bacterium]
MKVEQCIWTSEGQWGNSNPSLATAQLVFIFIGIDLKNQDQLLIDLQGHYPNGHLIFCSTAGEIAGDKILDESAVCTAIHFEKTQIKIHRQIITDSADSALAGKNIAEALAGEDLKSVFILSEGTLTNGDFLIQGVNEHLKEKVLITGGLAGDAGRFTQTFVGVNEVPQPGVIAAVGFYGNNIEIGHGSQGGWTEFGPIRTVTSSEKNVLYTLDNTNALELYKRYLGERAEELPGSALLFPLCIINDDGTQLVRT